MEKHKRHLGRIQVRLIGGAILHEMKENKKKTGFAG
jgi:hypothetical protein